MYTIIGIVVIAAIVLLAVVLFMKQPSFGRLPQGERLERIKHSPNYRDGEFKNQHETVLMTSNGGRAKAILNFLFKKDDNLRPTQEIPVIKTDLRKIDPEKNAIVWFGHSSYLMQIDRKRILVDPVFCVASPVSFVNKPFKGTDAYKPEDMPDIDYLVVTHDHWDHLDYQTIMQLKERVRKVICPLGVGEHFEYWGFEKDRIVELDWSEDGTLDTGFNIHCLPARHFSGRGLKANQSLWASFLLESPSLKIYIGGDGGYDTHFADIGKRFRDIDLAILENGQYNEGWKYIHLMPQYMEQAVKDLNPKKVLTVHHLKYALAKHPWDEPTKNALKMKKDLDCEVLIPQIGEVVELKKGTQDNDTILSL